MIPSSCLFRASSWFLWTGLVQIQSVECARVLASTAAMKARCANRQTPPLAFPQSPLARHSTRRPVLVACDPTVLALCCRGRRSWQVSPPSFGSPPRSPLQCLFLCFFLGTLVTPRTQLYRVHEPLRSDCTDTHQRTYSRAEQPQRWYVGKYYRNS